jgi:glutamyl-tRNA synthetase
MKGPDAMTRDQIRVRFAPSPTGYLHVGGARTALFNWLYARSQKGVFILRIEDTDKQRSTEDSLAAILRGMRWLGLDWDEGPDVGGPCGPYAQSERLSFYREALRELKARDQVYRCFCTDQELQDRAEAAKSSGGNWDGYDGHCRALGDQEASAREAAGQPCAWRLRTPTRGTTFWYDLVVGKREFQNSVITDRVVMKADGYPTYNFAVVVDDHTMGMTHVLRGDDHVSNTPFQLMIYEALGWTPPKFGHMPMILGPDRKRLSKRHGAVSIEEFQNQGIVPQAMVNYLALLGWSIGAGGDEVMPVQSLIKRFSIKKINSSPAAFDYDKLEHINRQHLKRMEPAERRALTLPILLDRGWCYDPSWSVPGVRDHVEYVDRLLELLGGRFSSLGLLPLQLGFFFGDDFERDQEAMCMHVTTEKGRRALLALADALEAGGPDAESSQAPPSHERGKLPAAANASFYEEIVRTLAERLDMQAGDLIHSARVALTGQNRSAGIFEVMETLGRPRVIARLRDAAS